MRGAELNTERSGRAWITRHALQFTTMRLTPPTKLTMSVSIACAIIGTIALCAGSFTVAAILGLAAAGNLIIASAINKY